MIALEKINKRKLTIYAVFALYWLFAYYFFKMFYGALGVPGNVSLVFPVIFLFISFACVDIHHRFITKPNLPARNYFRFFIFSLFVFIAAFWLESVLTFILHMFFWTFDNEYMVAESIRVRYQVGGVNMIVFGGVAFRSMIETLNLQRQKEEKDKQAVEANLKLKEVELSLLKSQVNPHFLFNALNCIYGLSLEKSEQTPMVIMQLSEILDYMLYKSDNKVLLKDEIKQIENYTAIQQVRFGDSLSMKFTKCISRDYCIAPLLLLTLVENAFKHGKPSIQGILEVNITINIDDKIHFRISNSCSYHDEDSNTTGGIGLNNLQRRLELLYNNRFELKANSKGTTYEAQLIIEPDENEEE